MSAKILVVDDESGMRRSLGIMLRREGYAVTEAPGGPEAADLLGRDVYDLVIADLRMEQLSGIDLLRLVKKNTPDVEVIVMTAFGTIESAVEAMRLGAYDFIAKPFQVEEILLRVGNALERRRLKAEVHLLRSEIKNAFSIEGIVGVSDAIRQTLGKLPRVAQTDSTVLVTGESGTGKELIARAVHTMSRRAHGPFVSVSCAALPEQLLENELFGHVRGAFTGALAARKGLLEEAQGGTFFLDEVGEAPLAIQAKLFRVLEDRTVRRLGSNQPVPIDLRIVAATNRDLEAAVRERTFREELLYRLNVIRIHLAPLRDRKDDIPLLARHFVAQHAARLHRDLAGIAPAAVKILAAYPFPGNVRELSNVIEQAVALAAGPLIEPHDLPDRLLHPTAPPPTSRPEPHAASLGDVVASTEREHLIEVLRETKWNKSRAAIQLKISRNTLRYRIDKYGLHP